MSILNAEWRIRIEEKKQLLLLNTQHLEILCKYMIGSYMLRKMQFNVHVIALNICTTYVG